MKDMLGRGEALSPREALKRVLDALPKTVPLSEEVPIEDAYGRVLAQAVNSLEDLPDFSRSTVDGLAVIAEDTFGASEGLPAYLKISGEVEMGQAPVFSIERGLCARIPTGGMLPQGANAVLMLEHANVIGETEIEALRPVAPGQNVIRKGEDAGKGELLLKEGALLRPQDIAAFAGVGITKIKVYEKPKVSIIVTGDEIIPPSEKMKPGEIRDMNSFTLAGLVLKEGGIPLKEGIIKDDYALLKEAFEKALLHSDMVLITGGSSVGQRDYTARLIAEKGEVLFHGVAMKPGKPTIGGLALSSSNDTKPVLGLPGHPAAVLVAFQVFARPVLRLISGLSERAALAGAGRLTARLSRDAASSVGRTQYLPVSLFIKDGALWAEPVPGPSGLIRTLIKGDGAIIIPEGRAGINKGEIVEVELFL
jgi:molybdopterin molybdotransferase